MELNFNGKNTKVQQLSDYLQDSISANELKVGDELPSINFLSQKLHVSRDTVFKAFKILKKKGLIDSIHGKSYFVTKNTSNILLLLDEYTPFKESLYNTLIKKLPLSYKVDLWFHQYNKTLFNSIIKDAYGRYNKYLVMNYENDVLSPLLKQIDPDRLLLLDFGKFEKSEYSYICQDFDKGFYNALASVKDQLSKYRKLIFILNKQHKHPQSSKEYFSRFCYDYGFLSEILDEVPESVSEKCCYIIIKQIDVVEIIKRGKEQNLVMGTDFGLITYNENPFYEIIGDGIPSFSIDFNLMGSLAADFVLTGEKIQQYLPTRVYRQNSI